MCGEHVRLLRLRPLGVGSSPRVRGTLGSLGVDSAVQGIIPACAGNTTEQFGIQFAPRDHPRVCREHYDNAVAETDEEGSSPRVRGTPAGEHLHVMGRGIIPACAGNTCARAHLAFSSRDHPRVCGEHAGSASRAARRLGSSPRVRGTRSAARHNPYGRGIIPACAGNTMANHPQETVVEGSSPRVRGTLIIRHLFVHAPGIIPACAGNTCARALCRPCCRDHPRVCGEHVPSPHSPEWLWGSSPRVRGTPQVRA